MCVSFRLSALCRQHRWPGRTRRRSGALTLAIVAALAIGIGAPSAQAPALSVKDVFALVHEQPASFERIWEQRFEAAAKDARGDTVDELRAARARGCIDFSRAAALVLRREVRHTPASL